MSEMVIDHLGGEFGLTAKIKDALLETRKQFVYIGFLLDEADRCEYYREGGYDSIYDYCEATFGFKKSSTNNFIRVYRCFGEAMALQSKYRDYSYSQLTEMCSMSPKEIDKCRPDMTVMDIRAVKKGDAFQISGKVCGEDPVVASVQTSGNGQGAFSSHYLALELYLKNRFNGKCTFGFVDDFMSFVLGQGAEFVVDIKGEGRYSSSVIFTVDGARVCFNGCGALISPACCFYILRRLSGVDAEYCLKGV